MVQVTRQEDSARLVLGTPSIERFAPIPEEENFDSHRRTKDDPCSSLSSDSSAKIKYSMPLSTSTLTAVTGVISLLISAWRQSSIPTGHIVPVQVSNLNCDTVKLSWHPVEANLNVFNKLTSVDFEDGLKTVGVTLDRERKARFTVLSQVRDGNDNSYVLQSVSASRPYESHMADDQSVK